MIYFIYFFALLGLPVFLIGLVSLIDTIRHECICGGDDKKDAMKDLREAAEKP